MIRGFSKEAHNEKLLDYKLNRLRFVRANDPYRHLLSVHDDDANNDAGAFDALTDFRVDQQHSKMREKTGQRQRRAWPVANVEFATNKVSAARRTRPIASSRPGGFCGARVGSRNGRRLHSVLLHLVNSRGMFCVPSTHPRVTPISNSFGNFLRQHAIGNLRRQKR